MTRAKLIPNSESLLATIEKKERRKYSLFGKMLFLFPFVKPNAGLRVGSSTLAMEETSAFTAIAIDKDRNSQLAVKWAVDNLLNTGSNCFLIHVRSQSLHPQDFEAAPKDSRPPSEAELQQFFLPYRGYCARKGIQSHEVVLHDIDVPSALVDFINKSNIGNIVVGASGRNVLTRKLRNPDVPTSLLKVAPKSCAVHVISKGKVQITRLASRPQTSQESRTPQNSPHLRALLSKHAFDSPKIEELNRTVSSCEGRNYRISSDRISHSFKVTPHYKLKTNDEVKSPAPSTGSQTPKSPDRISISESSNFSGPRSCQSTDISSHSSDCKADNSSSFASLTPRGLETEMRRLQQELKKSLEMFNLVTKEAVVAKEKARKLQEWKAAEERKLEEARLAEEAAIALAKAETQKTKAAMEAAHMARRLADMEAQKRKLAELKATHEEEAKRRALDQLVNNKPVYRKYTIDEIEAATNYFASSNKIGEGGYGPVFKATLDHTAVAVKVLRPDISQGQRQFQQEVEVLSCMRHPHMVLLIGACPEYGCLLYEYMENGSLEDRLFRKDNTPSIPWKTRFRIAAEIATGLLFLHQTKPEPLVHRDLKPANILLDRNYVSKISDVGLSRLVPATFADSITEYRLTATRGTFCYIDPEYQQTGMLGVKSDLYSFGVVLLQLITSRPPVGLTVHVQEAIEKGTFAEMLDPTVPDWPVEEALSLAKLALQCCELRKKDRPDLDSVVLPALNRLRDLASENEANNSEKVASEPPLYNSVPQNGSQENQIIVRSGWQRLKSMTRTWKASFLPPKRGPAGQSDKEPGELGCWSFVNCSGAPQQLRRVKSYSS
ncbi:U-box domain-containing protein 34-like [Durio zibethinus]|uniref:U-box domain-containing protein 34-like n=1 Tax=Durio zibethinus TaxID=66656 RepID=A0A6P5X5Q3_DURZI|nr:U-box domain-containing protein 34-like [Durio zibethinus]